MRRFAILTFLSITSFASAAFAQEVALKNPLNFSSIPEFIAGALKALALIALPIITLFLVISGFLFITAQGNQDKIKTAKNNFVYVVLGALLILGAWILATLIAGTVNQLTSR
ncbi:MAG: hypothetical protein HY422_00185 [Candidatus Komeilibacteria bacterium]|nr:hypothetical protein [Candidatus Komeilibacteria bacterium]